MWLCVQLAYYRTQVMTVVADVQEGGRLSSSRRCCWLVDGHFGRGEERLRASLASWDLVRLNHTRQVEGVVKDLLKRCVVPTTDWLRRWDLG